MAVALVAAAGVAAAKVPLHETFRVRCLLRPKVERPVVANRDLVLRAVTAGERQWVEPGAELFKLDVTESKVRLDRLRAEVVSLEAQVQGLKTAARRPAVRQAQAAVTRAERDAEAAAQALARLESAPRKPAAAKLSQAREAVAARHKALDEAKAALERVSSSAQLAVLASTLVAKIEERERARREEADAAVTAPAAGYVALTPGTAAGRHAAKGETLAVLRDARELLATAYVSGAEAELLEPAQSVTVVAEGNSAEGRVAQVGSGAAGGAGTVRVLVEVDNRERRLGQAGQGEVRVQGRTTTPLAWALRRVGLR